MLIKRSLDQSQTTILYILSMICSFFIGTIFSNLLEKPYPLVFQCEANQPTFVSPLYNLNTVTEEELLYLPGIGASTAKKIISYREQNLYFKTIDDLKKVPTIGKKKI